MQSSKINEMILQVANIGCIHTHKTISPNVRAKKLHTL